MTTSLIISIYKLQRELPLLLSAIAQQSQQPGEIIFAEDDVSAESIQILKEGSRRYPGLKMKLVQHEDRGFRKGEIVNKAVSIAENEKLIFLDGDCLPHEDYVRSYSTLLESGKLLNARPVYLETASRLSFVGSDSEYKRPSLLKIVRQAFRGAKYSIYLPILPIAERSSTMRGSSWACMKTDFLKVNGFDERFCEAGYGYEDVDISHRLNRAGVLCYVPKYRVIYYHFGPPGTGLEKMESMEASKKILDENDRKKLTFCASGIDKWAGRVFPSWVSN